MAIQLDNSFAVSVGGIVEASLDAARTVRSRDLAMKEAAFQTAVAEGNMSYKAQLAYRERQLADEKNSTFPDSEYIAQIENSIASTKKLARFERVRNKYTASLDAYVQGKSSLQAHMNTLQRLMNQENNPELLAELQSEMSALIKTQADNEVAAIENRSIVAQNDLSLPLIDKSIAEVKDRRAFDALNGNEEAVQAWDQTLNSLNNTRSSLIIQNSTNEITYRTNRNSLKIHQQVELIDQVANSANATTPFIYNGVRYESEKDYWTRQRDSIINSPDFWSSLSNELDAESSRIASLSPSGQVPITRIQEVNSFYNSLKTRPGFENYAERIEQERTSVLDASVNELATLINQEAYETGDYAKAEQTVMQLEQTFGIKVTRLPGANETSFTDQTNTAIKNATTPSTARVFTPLENTQLKAAQDRINSGAATPQDKANVEYAKKQGWSVAYTAPAETPQATPSVAPETKPTTTPQPSASTVPDNLTGVERQRYIEETQTNIKPRTATQPAATPVTTATPTPAVATSQYKGSSVVDYLRTNKQDSSFTARKVLADKYGIQGYTGSAEQNSTLLKKLQNL